MRTFTVKRSIAAFIVGVLASVTILGTVGIVRSVAATPTTSSATYTGPPATKKWASWQYKQAARAYVSLQVLQEAGFEGNDLREMAATWMAESGGKRWASNINTNGTKDKGPAQLNQPLDDGALGDERNQWFASAIETRRLFKLRKFKPWYAYKTANWDTQLPYVDVAISWLEKPDRVANGWP
jgi:hypothetical protein